MRKYSLVAVLMMVLFGAPSCCSKCGDKCEANSEVKTCFEQKAKKHAQCLAGKLELNGEQTAKLEVLFAKEFEKRHQAKIAFDTDLKAIVGEENFQKIEKCPKSCHRPCAEQQAACPNSQCQKKDSCCKEKPQCGQAPCGGCKQ